MVKKTNPVISVRSEEIQEVISHSPGFIIRYGMILLSFLAGLIILISWFVRYPDILKATITITTDPSPISLVSKVAGNIVLLKPENQELKEGDIFAYLKTNARYPDILQIERELEAGRSDFQNDNFELGSLQLQFNEVVEAAKEYQVFLKTDIWSVKVRHLKRQILSLKLLIKNQQAQYNLMLEECRLTKEKYLVDSILSAQKVITRLDFNLTKINYFQQLRNLKIIESNVLNYRHEVVRLEKDIAEFTSEKISQDNKLTVRLYNSLKELRAEIKAWKEKYLFLSPTDGRLAIVDAIENEQYIENGKTVFSIIPLTDKIYGRADLPVLGSGKVQIGQSVNIRLRNYPFEQFGILTGKVEGISLLPHQDRYSLKISLPNGLVSSHNTTIEFRHQLYGDTEIITEDIRLIERVFYKFSKLFSQPSS